MKALTALLFSALVVTVQAQTLDECRTLRHHGKLAEAQACFTRLAASSNPFLRAEGLWGIERYKEANDAFRDAGQGESQERSNTASAGASCSWSALTTRKPRACSKKRWRSIRRTREAYLGIAQVEAEGFSKKAVEDAQKAARLDPKLYQAHEAAGLSRARRQRRGPGCQRGRRGARHFAAKRWTPWRFICRHRSSARQEPIRPGPIASSRSIRSTAKPTPPPVTSSSSTGATTKASRLIARPSN